MNLFLDDYKLSRFDILQSIFISEYGRRHINLSHDRDQCKWGHRIIAIIEFCPIVGWVASAFEALVAHLVLPKRWVFRGDQEGCEGKVEEEKAKVIAKQLNEMAPKNVEFEIDRVGMYIIGGTCSAMSLSFADDYIRKNKLTVLHSSSQEMRTRQAAFNTLHLTRINPLKDPSKSKIKALLKFHNLKVVGTTEEIVFEKEPLVLPGPGVHVIRLLEPAENDNREKYGHTLVYIRENGRHLLYNPNTGCQNLEYLDPYATLLRAFRHLGSRFPLKTARFYQICALDSCP